jgi:hypothetical protein
LIAVGPASSYLADKVTVQWAEIRRGAITQETAHYEDWLYNNDTKLLAALT